MFGVPVVNFTGSVTTKYMQVVIHNIKYFYETEPAQVRTVQDAS